MLATYHGIKSKIGSSSTLAIGETMTTKLQEAYSLLTDGRELSAEREQTVGSTFKEIIEVLPKDGLGITHDEKVMIVKSMGFARAGHWYKCPNSKFVIFIRKFIPSFTIDQIQLM